MDRAADFPFTIMDVASLLRLNIRRRGAGHMYVDCPICGDHRGKMNLNLTKNVWRCNYCGEGGGMLALYAKVYGISNSEAYRNICDTLQTGGPAPAYTPQNKVDLPKEVSQSERADLRTIHHNAVRVDGDASADAGAPGTSAYQARFNRCAN